MEKQRLKIAAAVVALGLPILGWAGAAQAQQHLGNNVYVCDGAAHAGQCVPDEDDDDGGDGGDGYTDNDYLRGMSFAGYREQWGALAVGQIDSPGYIIGYSNSYGTGGDDTREEAEAKALRQCEYTANGRTACEIIETFVNACGSIAIGSDGDKPGRRFIGVTPIQGRPGDDGPLEAARAISKARATDLCEREQGAGQCEVRTTVCTPAIRTYR